MNLSRTTLQALGIESFVALSIRHTRKRSESTLHEIGLISIENGTVRHEITHPLPAYPQNIQDTASLLSPVAKEFQAFVDDRLVVYFENENYESDALPEMKQTLYHLLGPESMSLEIGNLGRILLPWHAAFDTGSLAEHFELHADNVQTPVHEARQSAALFLELAAVAMGLDLVSVRILHQLTQSEDSALSSFFERLAALQQSQSKPILRPMRLPSRNKIGNQAVSEQSEQSKPISADEINYFFEENGPLSERLVSFEKRPQQLAMARSVAVTFNQNEFLVAEAGTGVGKSFAYLLPAILWVTRESSRRVILATHTKTLQDQLFRKEIPVLHEMIEASFQAILLKGRSNYVCLRRWEALTDFNSSTLNVEQSSSLLPLVVWMSSTQDGDIEENAAFSVEQNRNLWQQIQSEEGLCLRSACPNESRCFLNNARRQARAADVVVVNHALLLSDFLSDHAILGNFDTLILDEAHQFEKVSTQHLGTNLTGSHFSEILLDIHKEHSRNDRFLDRLNLAASKLKNPSELNTVRTLINHTRGMVDSLLHGAEVLFDRLSEHLQGPGGAESGEKKSRIKESPLESCAAVETEKLIDGLVRLVQMLTQILEKIKQGENDAHDQLDLETMQILDRLVGLRQRIDFFYSADYEQNIVWFEMGGRAAKKGLSLFSVPLDVSELLGTQYYPGITRCVLTSATLTVGNDFDYIITRLGLDRLDPERLITHVFGSPFDYNEQVRMLIPTYLPSPKHSNFVEAVSGFVFDLLELHGRGTLVLFTSYAMLQSVYDHVRTHRTETSTQLLGQGIDGPRSALLKYFQETKSSVLFGTNSFWEGIDVPGDALEMLIITKIPFDVPTEPVFQARYEYAEKLTGSGFMHYAVPEAIIRFRQGFGRLIRSGSDRGVIILMDKRVTSTKYGQVLLESLPVVPECHDSQGALLHSLENWFGQTAFPVSVLSSQEKDFT